MAWVALLQIPAWLVGGAIGIACIEHQVGCKRDLASLEQPLLFQFNTTNLRGQDLERLYGLKVSTAELQHGQAVFSNQHFSSKGFFSQNQGSLANGLRQGEVSFSIPGVDAPFKGAWIAVNHENADEKTVRTFEKMHLAIKDSHGNIEKSMADTFLDIVEMLDTAVEAESH